MQIAIIAHLKYAIREPFAGGLEMHTHMLASRLRRRGHDVTLFASLRSDPALGTEAICEETAVLETGVAEAQDIVFFREHHAYLSLMTTLRDRHFDVIHNNSLHYIPVSMAPTIATPMVTTLHTPPFCWLESGIRLCPEGAMRYVAVSEATARMWSHVARVDRIVPNGVDLSQFRFSPVASEEPYLVWYGRIVPEKGLDLAIAAANFTGVKLRIAGPISDRCWFEERIAPLLSDTVIYEGHLQHDALSDLVGGARAALCTPRWDEPYGLVVAEALACGTPVAAFARGGVPDVLGASGGQLARPDDPVDLARAVQVAMTMSRFACRYRAEQACDAECMVDRYEDIYREMMAKPRLLLPALEATAA